MKKSCALAIIGLSVLFLMGCHKKMFSAGKRKNNTDRVGMEDKKDVSPAQLAMGDTIFINNCANCHEYHEPGEFTAKQWDDILPEMTQKAKLNDEDAALVTAWIKSKAKV